MKLKYNPEIEYTYAYILNTYNVLTSIIIISTVRLALHVSLPRTCSVDRLTSFARTPCSFFCWNCFDILPTEKHSHASTRTLVRGSRWSRWTRLIPLRRPRVPFCTLTESGCRRLPGTRHVSSATTLQNFHRAIYLDTLTQSYGSQHLLAKAQLQPGCMSLSFPPVPPLFRWGRHKWNHFTQQFRITSSHEFETWCQACLSFFKFLCRKLAEMVLSRRANGPSVGLSDHRIRK